MPANTAGRYKNTGTLLQRLLLSVPQQWPYFRSTGISLLVNELLRSETGTVISLLKPVC